ncbi:Crp/Fnr family transcriptional regulator [Mucilaginibacter paludis]|uniref:Transcriptional regulator, Crp/Fnr family n=1 Tax=Mucilaginibacter paludis DSM 18603 TaxID=714943 RepID=H1Y867_9SPHI|nr:Crp/Fnr family transcriptional regulator [Mucilaginibacter paludis]EHQ31089.1 putative transcriptional regulator, Crp/Fnr family [Mucilaginibacter paludis DSM 18603]
MSHELILKNILKHIDLNEEETTLFLSLIKFKNVTKKTLLLKSGENCKYINYVHSGVLRAYHLDKEGRESTIMFAAPDWWVTDMYCFLNGKPAMMYIEALEDSGIIQLSKEHLEKLFYKVPKFERFFRILMQNAYTREQLRVIENLSLTAEERYESFLIKYPHIAKLVAQKQIASYLGITPEFLSAIKKNKKT